MAITFIPFKKYVCHLNKVRETMKFEQTGINNIQPIIDQCAKELPEKKFIKLKKTIGGKANI